MLETPPTAKSPAAGPGASRTELPALTGTRYLAAMWVVVYHLTGRIDGSLPTPLRTIVDRGWMGVPFFFILSGFILAHVYGRRFGAGTSRQDRLGFWWARFARVYPLYFLALVLSYPVYARFVGDALTAPLALADQVATFLLIQAWIPWLPNQLNEPAWSLSVEALFYVSFPWMMAGVARWAGRSTRSAWTLAAGLWAVGATLQALMAFLPNPYQEGWIRNLQSIFPPWWMPFFLMGIALQIGWAHRQELGLRLPRAVLPATLAALALLLAFPEALSPVAYGLSTLVAEGLFGVLIVALASPSTRGLLASKASVALGEASYGIYLLHLPANDWVAWALGRAPTYSNWEPDWFLGETFANTWVELGLFVLALSAFCLAVHAAYERPVRRWLLARGPGRRPPPTAAAPPPT